MQVITVCNRKGGMGKSTTVVNLARHWSLNGFRVLVIDLDSQGHATLGLLGEGYYNAPTHTGIHEWLCADGDPTADMCLSSPFAGLDVLPASLNFNESNLPNDVTRLKSLVDLQDGYDVVLIDTPPSLSNALLNALVASNWVLVPFIPHSLALQGIMQLAELFKHIAMEYNPTLKLLGLLPVMVDRHIRLQNRVITTLQKRFGDQKILRGVRTNISLAEAFEAGCPVHEYAPKCKGALDYHMLAHTLSLQVRP